MKKALRILFSLGSAVGLACAAVFTGLAAGVDTTLEGSHSPEVTERACRTFPMHAPCWAALARQKAELGTEASQDWLLAHEREPRDWRTLLSAALSREAAGAVDETERLLLGAANQQQLWMPRWALASFYYRHQRWPEFWHWSRAALDRLNGDPAALFRLCVSAAPSAAGAANRLVLDDPLLRARFIEFLSAQPERNEASEIALAMPVFGTGTNTAEVRASLLRAAERMLTRGAPEGAHRLWRVMGERGILSGAVWTADSPLANGDFSRPLEPPVFDWRIYRLDGLETLDGAPPGTLKFTFTGQQAESIPLIEQWVWVPAGRAYLFQCEFRAKNLEPGPAALTWRWVDQAGIDEKRSDAPSTTAEWANWQFALPPAHHEGLHKLVLWAARPSGSIRLEGEAWIRSSRLRPLRAGVL